MATDESYRDPTNLQSKLQKHQAFEAELTANKGRVDSVTEVYRSQHAFSRVQRSLPPFDLMLCHSQAVIMCEFKSVYKLLCISIF